MPLANTDMLKGSTMMIFRKVGTGTSNTSWRSIGFATNHQLSVQVSTSSVSTKDHGDYAANLPQYLTWTVTAENIYSDAGELAYMNLLQSMEPLEIYFSKATSTTAVEGNIVGTQAATGTQANGSWTRGTVIAHGQAIVTDLSINAPAGDYATLSVTFTGVGELKTT